MVVVFRKEAPKIVRNCAEINVQAKRPVWLTDEAFSADDFSASALITENDVPNRVNITADLQPVLTPEAAADAKYGETSAAFRYQGSDPEIAGYFERFTVTAPVLVYLRGDGDLNGEVDLSDAMMALRAYTEVMGGKEPSNDEVHRYILDVDQDGEATLNDAMFILRYSTLLMADKTPDWKTIIKK